MMGLNCSAMPVGVVSANSLFVMKKDKKRFYQDKLPLIRQIERDEQGAL
jgi:hypothetical protein